jgi:hypothetical protein
MLRGSQHLGKILCYSFSPIKVLPLSAWISRVAWDVETSDGDSGNLAWLWALITNNNKNNNIIISVCLSVCPSFRPLVRMEQFGSRSMDFHEMWYLCIFQKSVKNIQVSLESYKNKRHFQETCVYLWSFRTNILGKIKTHILFSMPFARKSCPSWDNVEKYGTARQATDNNMAHARCMFDPKTTNTDSEYVILTVF